MVTERIKVLGVDAAFANTGIVLADYIIATGKIEVSELRLVHTEADKTTKKVVRKNSDDLRRAKEAIAGIAKAILDYKPSFVFAEVPFGAQSARAAWCLGIAVGVIAGISVPVIQLSPNEVKLVVGTKHPDKAEMIAWAVNEYPNANWPMKGKGENATIIAGKAEHMADAVATVHAGIATPEFVNALQMFKLL